MLEIAPDHIASTGDDRPARSLARFVWRMSGWRQVLLGLIALAAAALNLAPIELQRRIIDDAIMDKDVGLLMHLAVLYGAALLLQRLTKFALGIGQGWVGESAILYCRRHLFGLWSRRDARRPGEAVSITGREIDQLGGFVGTGPSQAIGDAGMLLGLVAYMAWTEPMVAGVSLALLTPQLLIAPPIQHRINALTADRLALMRRYGDVVAGHDDQRDAARAAEALYANRIRLTVWKHLLKGLLNALTALAPLGLLLYGGWLAIRGETTVGVLVAFLSGLQRVVDPMRGLLRFYRDCSDNGVRHRLIADWM